MVNGSPGASHRRSNESSALGIILPGTMGEAPAPLVSSRLEPFMTCRPSGARHPFVGKRVGFVEPHFRTAHLKRGVSPSRLHLAGPLLQNAMTPQTSPAWVSHAERRLPDALECGL